MEFSSDEFHKRNVHLVGIGYEGHGGVHVCSKCGWPFPNAHPSAKHRRAHKKVCGTIEGYKLDNSQDKIHVNGSDGEHVSDDDDHKTSSDKVVERTISRRSSSGVGSRSSRSTRSEDEVFTDAATDFVDSLGVEEATYGVIERGNSLNSITENDLGTKHTVGNSLADKLCAPDTLLEDNQVPLVQTLEIENTKMEASTLSQGNISSSTINLALNSDSDSTQNENAVEQNICREEGKENLSSKEPSELMIPYSEVAEKALENVYASRDVSDELLEKGMQTNGFEDEIACSHEVFDAANVNRSELSDMIEERDSMVEVIVPDGLPLKDNLETAVEDLDHRRGKFNFSMAPETNLAFESVEYSKSSSIEESCSNFDSAKPSESYDVCSEDDAPKNVRSTEDILKQEVGESKSSVEQKIVEERDLISCFKASNDDISKFKSEEILKDIRSELWEEEKVGCGEEHKPLDSLDDISDSAKPSESYDVCSEDDVPKNVQSTDESKSSVEQKIVEERDLISCFKTSNDDISEFKSEEILKDIRSELWEDEKIGCAEKHKPLDSLDEHVFPEVAIVGSGDDRETSSKGGGLNASDGLKQGFEIPEEELAVTSSTRAELAANDRASQVKELINNQATDDTVDDEEISISGILLNGNDKEPFERDRNFGQEELDEILDSERVLTSQATMEIQSAGNMGEERDCEDKDERGVVETDDCRDSTSMMTQSGDLEVCDERERITKQNVDLSAVDSPEGNSGPGSVAQHATEAGSVSSEKKAVEDGRHTQSETSADLMEVPSEIHVSQNHELIGGNTSEEIISSKVPDWGTAKQHTALKTLLGEATAKSRAESPIHNEPQKDEIEIPVMKDNGLFSVKPENVILSSKESKVAEGDMGREWNSPARYPVNIKTEKRRAKSRPYWAPFLCCSSVNAS